MIRGIAAGNQRVDNNWNIIRVICQSIWKHAKTPAKEIAKADCNTPKSALKTIKFFGIFRCQTHKIPTFPSLNEKLKLLQNARAHAFQFNLKSFQKFKFIVTRLVQLGFIGFVCTNLDGHGFTATKIMGEDITALAELLRTKETSEESDNESDIIILNESDFDDGCDNHENTEETNEMALPNPDDMKEFAEMNLLLQVKLKQLEPLVKQMVDEKIQQEKELSESREREKYFERRIEELEKKNKELLKRERLMLEQVKKMMKEEVDNHAQTVMENWKRLDDLSADCVTGCTGPILKTFVEGRC